ncbi:TrmB family transcriptional regulator [Streptomyces blattellae]|uniref:TrmB family transcriptional regulator n=1 Tax=Streptomyces blattellae TaxID=2569855 RepID=UPI0012B98E93|nr:TrmB family transcriptional regulator [Streptomyces blattellae]
MLGVDDLIAQLQFVGMTGYEAKAYIALISAGEALNGYEVAKRSGVPRSTVYEVLGKLKARNAAYEVKGDGDATAYVPMPPTMLLSRIRRETEASLDSLEHSLRHVTTQQTTHLTHPLSGRKQLIERCEDLIGAAQQSLLLFAWPTEYEELAPLLRRAADKGIRVEMVYSSMTQPEEPVGYSVLHRTANDEESLASLGCRLLIVGMDNEQVVIGGLVEDEAWGVFADDPAIVLVATELLRYELSMQLVLAKLGVEEKARDVFTTDPEVQRFRTPGRAAALLQRLNQTAFAVEPSREPLRPAGSRRGGDANGQQPTARRKGPRAGS